MASHGNNDIENLKATELTLRPPGSDMPEKPTTMATKCNKRPIPDSDDESCRSRMDETEEMERKILAPLPKAQVVGWPPVRAYRMNSFRGRKSDVAEENPAKYVKVSMDGAPYLRKLDLKVYKGYEELRGALQAMFKCFSSVGMEGSDEYEYAITYEDKDGDWMLVGDVPWEMFISSCKRMRIMKGTEARGLSSCA
uniref:Auxin-responsive protein n=1 Tax=Ananas comosus var. bracteatus TaxID=296719 RepID=A0A6V7NSF6_ANACO|nr:unnamed protein product [Ananas comosus var. bracteatus]